MPDGLAARGDAATRNRIAARAYEIWESQGCPHGSDMAHWHQAEAEIMNGATSSPANRVEPAAKPKRAKAAKEPAATGKDAPGKVTARKPAVKKVPKPKPARPE